MNGEWAIIFCFVASPLFAAGGTEIPALKKGYKWLRRELLPILWATIAFLAGFEWWRCAVFAVCQDAVFRLPYGDRTPPWLKFLIFLTYPLPSMWLGFNIWQAYSGLLCFILFILSNWKPTAKAFEWVISCLLIGAFIGITVGSCIAQTFHTNL